MPLPQPTQSEDKEQFLIRCMGDDKMNAEYPDANQRYAVCIAQYENK